MTRALHRLTLALLLGYATLALLTGYWSLVRGPDLRADPDNPRRVEALRRIPRGTIFDVQQRPLANSHPGTEPDTWERVYQAPVAAPVVGYWSIKHGASGIEARYDALLLGQLGRDPQAISWDTFTHAVPIGRDVRLTLDLTAQSAADSALGPRRGAVLVLDATTGDLLALISHPTFDPNQIDTQFDALMADPDAPLLNRTTQGAYQPGPALLPLLIGAALDQGNLTPTELIVDGGAPLTLADGLTLTCASTRPTDLTAGDALTGACPAFAATLGARFTVAGLDQLFTRAGLYAAPDLPLPITQAIPTPLAADARALAAAASGQGTLTVTPLHIALITAAWASDGKMPAPRLVAATQTPAGVWENAPAPAPARPLFSSATAAQLRAWLTEPALPGGAGASGVARVGGLGTTSGQAWFTGFVLDPANNRTLVITVLVEQELDPAVPRAIAHTLWTNLHPGHP